MTSGSCCKKAACLKIKNKKDKETAFQVNKSPCGPSCLSLASFAVPGSVMGVSIQEETRGCEAPCQVLLAPPPRMRHSCLSEPRRSSLFILESQKKKKKRKKSGHLIEYLFCIVVCHTKDVHYVWNEPLFAERNNNLELSVLECIINVISSCLGPSVCVEWWVWAPGMDGLGTRAARQ